MLASCRRRRLRLGRGVAVGAGAVVIVGSDAVVQLSLAICSALSDSGRLAFIRAAWCEMFSGRSA